MSFQSFLQRLAGADRIEHNARSNGHAGVQVND
ncbi:MAG: hypothetical protein ACI90Y_002306, partial [Polaromonas sp.]